MTAPAPTDEIEIPQVVRELAAARRIAPVWRNELGGLTFRLGSGPPHEFVKWQPVGTVIDLYREAERLAWAARFTPVPPVLGIGRADGGEWLHTAALPCSPAWPRRRPSTAWWSATATPAHPTPC